MIIVLNGYPGVGKLTIGHELIGVLGARLLDIHSVYNIAFALTEFKSQAFMDAVERIEAVAHDLVCQLPEDVPVVLTTVLTEGSAWGDAEWGRIVRLGRTRPPFCVVHLACALDENVRRIQSEGRGAKRKPRDADMARRNHADAKPLLGLDQPNLLRLDVTTLSPEDAAKAIAEWVHGLPPGATA
ncbi:MAG: AAA family ATPase [Devosia sp.]|uniref:AAA family ATPase n=1 Tax=Devosia sp. TaxID=1871048 RepID=UPI0024C84429|nr:AAA family ATPase [Devosia sp.]UYN98128.1 MAG: AAA family ATPase [Devosia sp.]